MSSAMTVTALTQTTLLFTTLLPKPSDLRNVTDSQAAEDVHTMQCTAAVLSLSIGVGLSVIEGDAGPFLVTVLSVAVMWAGSEILVRQQPSERIAP